MKFIVIGGISRSGTTTVGIFLALHPEITVYDGPILHPDLNKLTSQKLQYVPGSTDERNIIEKYLEESINGSILCSRGDCWENHYEYLNRQKNTKFIYCMRENPFYPLRSQCVRSLIFKISKERILEYESACFTSLMNFDNLTIPKMIFSVDKPNYEKLLDFLGVGEPTDNMKDFIENNYRVHFTDENLINQFEKVEFSDELESKWNFVFPECGVY